MAKLPIAIIDIGSNSVRLVVYDDLKRRPLQLFNEKILCGLGRGLSKTGRLNERGIILALETIARFTSLARQMNSSKIIALATAAVRDASDGRDFIREVSSRFNLEVRILSGPEEAKMAALGVLSAVPFAEGVVGDLGGGSLELSEVKSDGRSIDIKHHQSFPIGPLRLIDGGDIAKAQKEIDKHLQPLRILKSLKGRTFYAVGGGFRAIAKTHIQRSHYPIHISHNYSIPSEEFLQLCKQISKMPVSKLKTIPAIGESRADTIALTALIGERIIQLGRPKKVLFSTHGIREGFIYEMLPQNVKSQDPLISGCMDMVSEERARFGQALFEWSNPIFAGESKALKKLRQAASILSSLGWYEHSEYRADISFRKVLESPLTGIDHSERVFLALSLYHRYKSTIDKRLLGKLKTLVSSELIKQAQILGSTLRLGHRLAGGIINILDQVPLKVTEKHLILEIPKNKTFLLNITVEKRLLKLAKLLNKTVSK